MASRGGLAGRQNIHYSINDETSFVVPCDISKHITETLLSDVDLADKFETKQVLEYSANY